MTDAKRIEQLLKAFYNGDTTTEEEAMLADILNNEDIDESLHSERDIFNVLRDTSDIPLPEGITERLEKAIDIHIAKTSSHENERTFLNSKTRKLFVAISSAAAVVLLCIGLFLSETKNNHTGLIADTYSNPKEAALVAEQTLLFVSNKLNKGLSPLEKITEGVDKANELLNESINKK